MKNRLLIAAVIALSAAATVGSVFAERPYPDEPAAVSTKTRAEVQAELEQAIKDGSLINSGEGGYSVSVESVRRDIGEGAHGVAGSRYSGRTREEVKAELEQARRDGSLMNSDELYKGQ